MYCDGSPRLKAGASTVLHRGSAAPEPFEEFSLDLLSKSYVECFTWWTSHPNQLHSVVKEPHCASVESFQLLPLSAQSYIPIIPFCAAPRFRIAWQFVANRKAWGFTALFGKFCRIICLFIAREISMPTEPLQSLAGRSIISFMARDLKQQVNYGYSKNTLG